MKRAALYSSVDRSAPPQEPEEPKAARKPRRRRLRAVIRRRGGVILFLALIAVIALLAQNALKTQPPELIQEDIDSAVLNTLETKTLPSRAAKAAEAVRQSVVRVRGRPASASKDGEGSEKEEVGIGTGVVIVDDGLILTNFHVVAGAGKIDVTFYDGSESEAMIVGLHPDKDLAVIRAKTIPDDLPAATLGSTYGLRPGDEVVAVGFPFGVGPSVSSGVISGLDRAFRSPRDDRRLTGLIQFDAAANPGNSGGPLVTMDGEVVGIVTAILNPAGATFIGIGFATTIESAASTIGIPPF
jgi:S1-C subfamily serine protease